MCRANARSNFGKGDTAQRKDSGSLENKTGLNSNPSFCPGDVTQPFWALVSLFINRGKNSSCLIKSL